MPGTSRDESQLGADLSDRGTTRRDADNPTSAEVVPHAQPPRAPGTADGDATWCYEQSYRGGGRRHFTGDVSYVGGAEGQRLRAELAAVVADLLRWARQHQAAPNPGDTDHGRAA